MKHGRKKWNWDVWYFHYAIVHLEAFDAALHRRLGWMSQDEFDYFSMWQMGGEL